jgi:hypothetical protein
MLSLSAVVLLALAVWFGYRGEALIAWVLGFAAAADVFTMFLILRSS